MVRLTKEQRADLTREKSLTEVAKLARKHLPRHKALPYVALGIGVLTAAGAVWTGALAKTLGDRVREWSSAGFQFAYGILGILLAGFAIYTAVALSDLAPALAATKSKRTGVSEMKTLALHFVDIFIPFLAFVALHFAVMFFGWEGGPAAKVSGYLGVQAQRVLTAGMLGVIAAALSYLAGCLWVFVFNVYASFMMMARSKVHLSSELAEDPAEAGQTEAASLLPTVDGTPVAPPAIAPPIAVRVRTGGAVVEPDAEPTEHAEDPPESEPPAKQRHLPPVRR